MPFLADLNVWLALLVKEHIHHAPAFAWFETLGPSQGGICRVIQLALLRLLCNRSIMAAGALTAAEAWNKVVELLQDERVKFYAEPQGLDSFLPGMLGRLVPAPNLITDAYLAAFAMATNLRLATFDHGFRQFRGLRVMLVDS
jgi:toxin-antitoxin system PIN domain toxin